MTGGRESVLHSRGNAQPWTPLRGILALQGGEDVNSGPVPAISVLPLGRSLDIVWNVIVLLLHVFEIRS